MKPRLFRSFIALLLCAALAASALCGCLPEVAGKSDTAAALQAESTGAPQKAPASLADESTEDPDFLDYDLPKEETTAEPAPADELPADDGQDYARALAKKNQDRAPEQAVLTQSPGLAAAPPKTWTVMVYMIGSNLESQYGSATKDMLEMEEAGLDPEQVNLLLYTGGARTWKGDVPADRNCVLDMHRTGADRIIAATDGNADMGSPETLAAFVRLCTELYPARHTMLILWDHGGGPLWGYGSDELFGSDALLLSEMKEAMQRTAFGRGRKLDFIGFDACLMGCYENMALWRAFADHYIGSEELEPGDGWDYHFLSVLNETEDPQTVADAVTTHFYEYYSAKTTDVYRPQVTLSCTDLSQVPQVTTALRALFARMALGVQTGKYAALQQARSAALSFGRVETVSAGSYSYDLVDLKDLAIRLAALYPAEAAAVTRALNGFTVSQVSTVDGAGGVSLFYPCENKGQFEKMSGQYRTVNVSADYSRFLDSIAAEWRSAKSRDWVLGELSVTDGEMQLQLTEDQLQNMSSVYYSVLNYDESGCLFLLDKCSLTPDRDGVVHIPADPQAFYLDNGSPDRGLWPVEQTGRSKDRLYFQTVSMQLYSDPSPLEHQEDLVRKNVSLSFSTDLNGGDLKIGSITSTAESFDTLGKETLDLGDWEAAAQTAARIVPTRDLQGRLLPAAQWNTNELTSIRTAPYDGSFTFGLAPVSQMSEAAVCQVVIEDVNGEAYASELCPIRSASYEPVSVDTEDGTFDYLVYADHAVLIGFSGSAKEPVIPAVAGGQPVTELYSGAFGTFTLYDQFGYSPITGVTLPDTLKILHRSAFQHCRRLTEIRLPEGLTTIGDNAFSGCTSLQTIVLPSTVTSIGKAAFDSCAALQEAVLPPALDYLGTSVFSNCKSLKTILGDAVSGYRLSDGALYDASGTVLIAFPAARTGSFTVPNGTRRIACAAFNRSSLSEVHFPEGLTHIGNYAFYWCMDLAVPAFPDSLVSVGAHAFGASFGQIRQEDIPEPAELHLGPSLESIGPGAFDGLAARFFTVDEANPRFAASDGALTNKARDTLLAYAADRSLVFSVPEGVTAFDWTELDPFENYQSIFDRTLVHVLFPDSVASVSGAVSSYNAKYHSVIHANPGTAAQRYAELYELSYSPDFSWTWETKTFETADGIVTARLYEDHAAILFYQGTADPVVLPDTLDGLPVTVLGGGDFPVMMVQYPYGNDYTELGYEPEPFAGLPQTLILPDTLTTLAADCLFGLGGIPNLDLPDGITRIERAALDSEFARRLSAGDFPPALSYLDGGFIWNYTGTFPVTPALTYVSPEAFKNSKKMAGFVQEGENGLYCVRDGVLYSADGKTLLLCPGGLVRDGAFSVPEGTEAIGPNAFLSTELRDMRLPSSLREVQTQAFSISYYLETVTFSPTDAPLSIGERAFESCWSLHTLSFAEGLTSIGPRAFNYCSALAELSLPDSLITIGENAFWYCSALETVRFGSGLAYIGDYAFSDCAKLSGLTLPDSLVTVGASAFQCKQQDPPREPFVLHLGPNLRSIGNCAFMGLPVSAFDVDPENRFFRSSAEAEGGTPGLLLSANGSQLIACPCAMTGTVTLPACVSQTQYGSFGLCPGVTEVVIPDTVLFLSLGMFTRYDERRQDPETGKTTHVYYYLQTIRCTHGSYAENYAITREIPYVAE